MDTPIAGPAYGHHWLQRAEPVLPRQGEALPNTEIFSRLAARFGFRDACFTADDAALVDEAMDPADLRLQGLRPSRIPTDRALAMTVDYQEAKGEAERRAREERLQSVPPFHRDLVLGVGTYALELFRATPDLDAVYVPIGMGSGICGVIGVREALGLPTRVIGVQAERAPCYALSFAAGRVVSTDSADTVADGVATRTPDPEAFETIRRGAERIVTVTEEEIAEAMRDYYTDTHNLAEGAGAAPLAALLKEQEAMRGRKVGLVLSGGNVDLALWSRLVKPGC